MAFSRKLRSREVYVAFSGRQDTSIIGMANRDQDAESIASSAPNRVTARGVVQCDEVRFLCRGEQLPPTAYSRCSAYTATCSRRSAKPSSPWIERALRLSSSSATPSGRTTPRRSSPRNRTGQWFATPTALRASSTPAAEVTFPEPVGVIVARPLSARLREHATTEDRGVTKRHPTMDLAVDTVSVTAPTG